MLQHCAAGAGRRCDLCTGAVYRTASRWKASFREVPHRRYDPRLDGNHHPFNFFFKAEAPTSWRWSTWRPACRSIRRACGLDAADLKIGQKLRLQFEPVSKEVTLPVFIAD